MGAFRCKQWKTWNHAVDLIMGFLLVDEAGATNSLPYAARDDMQVEISTLAARVPNCVQHPTIAAPETTPEELRSLNTWRLLAGANRLKRHLCLTATSHFPREDTFDCYKSRNRIPHSSCRSTCPSFRSTQHRVSGPSPSMSILLNPLDVSGGGGGGRQPRPRHSVGLKGNND